MQGGCSRTSGQGHGAPGQVSRVTRVGAEKAGAAPGRARAPRFGDRSSLCRAPSTAWTFWTSFFLLFFLVPLALAPPPQL